MGDYTEEKLELGVLRNTQFHETSYFIYLLNGQVRMTKTHLTKTYRSNIF